MRASSHREWSGVTRPRRVLGALVLTIVAGTLGIALMVGGIDLSDDRDPLYLILVSAAAVGYAVLNITSWLRITVTLEKEIGRAHV